MTKFWRDGHTRVSQYGTVHRVRGHEVHRDVWDPVAAERADWTSGRGWTRRRLDEGIPNAKCPKCFQPVWFYRNPNGGCAYFDELGRPWPKHPCLDTRSPNDRAATWQAEVLYRALYEVAEPDDELESVRAAYDAWRQSARDSRERSWDWEIEQAQDCVDEALAEMLAGSRVSTSKAMRKKRESWRSARASLATLEVERVAAQDAVEASRERYLTVLNERY
jgi:hypothetical protein